MVAGVENIPVPIKCLQLAYTLALVVDNSNDMEFKEFTYQSCG